MMAIAELIWQRFGYASLRTAETALREQFHREGLSVRSKTEQLAFIRGSDIARVFELYESGLSANEIARDHWQQWGYRNQISARRAINKLLARHGIPARTHSERARARSSIKAGREWRQKLVCINGHPYTRDNTQLTAGRRRCRECNRITSQRHREAA